MKKLTDLLVDNVGFNAIVMIIGWLAFVSYAYFSQPN